MPILVKTDDVRSGRKAKVRFGPYTTWTRLKGLSTSRNFSNETSIRSYFSEGNSVSFPERYAVWERPGVWYTSVLWMRSPRVKGFLCSCAALCRTDPLSRCQSQGFFDSSGQDIVSNLFWKRKSYKLIHVFYTSTHFQMYLFMILPLTLPKELGPYSLIWAI